MKYCSKHNCGKVFEDGQEPQDCPNCYYRKDNIKPLPIVAYDIEKKCRKCGSTEELIYREPWSAGKFQYGNEYECRKCYDEFLARVAREEAMQYIVITDDDVTLYSNKDELESYIEDEVSDWDWESIRSFCEDSIVLKVERLEKIKKESFEGRNIFLYEDEFYLVESVSELDMEESGTINISF